MDELNSPAATPPAAPEPKDRGGRAVKRVAVVLLFALFVLSLTAGVLLVRYGGENSRLEKAMPMLAKANRQEIGWIAVRGVISDSQDNRPWAVSEIDQWSKRLREFGEDASVKAIVLEINSPGGSVGAVQELHAQILKVRSQYKKPIIALMDDVAASGGYYIAAACDKIVAHPGTLTGSIGVIFHAGNWEGLMKKIGVTDNAIKSGKMKDIGSPTRPMTQEERDLLQSLIMESYGQFLGAVEKGRDMSEDKLKPLADGRIFTGTQAKQEGLVDQVGTSLDAIELAKQLGHITGEPHILRRQEDVFDRFVGMLDEAVVPQETRLSRLFEELSPAGLEYRWRP